ncbi:flagellar hook-basal body complex protein FliE [Novosphingobium beihaiensis]|uniref:Flagellar hook-basal body complex protein FliE n=1 Tax=Novosphingobium beihaiensis TaxID=2930389 RepID=A0ABT0BPK5_9SPHN|nr:flagellar hook-basal body complex protein FliE [Novosphingobium beihaiensis]MCJ2186992.1 flagellar hook-basal body complex protein FliE [Novosphingobium beihaiensis]
MTETVPVAAISALDPIASSESTFPSAAIAASSDGLAAQPANFVNFLEQTVRSADAKVGEADRLVQKFAVDENSVPIHQVAIALEQARLSVELMVQVRARALEAYRDLMNMQV